MFPYSTTVQEKIQTITRYRLHGVSMAPELRSRQACGALQSSFGKSLYANLVLGEVLVLVNTDRIPKAFSAESVLLEGISVRSLLRDALVCSGEA
jgi:hypothetical protein